MTVATELTLPFGPISVFKKYNFIHSMLYEDQKPPISIYNAKVHLTCQLKSIVYKRLQPFVVHLTSNVSVKEEYT